MVTENHYRWDFIGLSTDEKPTPATSERVVDGSTYYTSDDSKLYVFCKDQWYEKIPIGGGGGGGDEPAGDGVISAYDSEKGEITGTGFGSTEGKVYMLDRDTHSYVEQEVKKWTPTTITLKNPLDLEHLEGTTSIVALLDNGTYSTKFLVTGEVDVEGYGKVYIKDASTGVVRTATATTSSQITGLYQSQQTDYSKSFTVGGDTFYADELVGIQFGEDFTSTSISQQNFLCDFVNLNQPVVLPDTLTSLASYFMCCCYNFNQPIKFNLTTIPIGFLEFCFNFNQPFDIPSTCTSIAQNFLGGCYNFNQPLTLPTGLTTIGQYFLSDNNRRGTSFNQPLTIPNTVTTIGQSFLAGNRNFNQPIELPSSVTIVPEGFLYECYKFNSEIKLPNTITKINGYFLYGCQSFNQPIEIPDSVTEIGDSFLSHYSATLNSCPAAFNQEITLPSDLTKIGTGFMCCLPSFNKKITVPASVTSIGTYFLYADYAFSELEVNTNTAPTDNNSLSSNKNTAKTYTKGITLTGTGASAWLTALPNRTSSPYRKLIDGTAE